MPCFGGIVFSIETSSFMILIFCAGYRFLLGGIVFSIKCCIWESSSMHLVARILGCSTDNIVGHSYVLKPCLKVLHGFPVTFPVMASEQTHQRRWSDALVRRDSELKAWDPPKKLPRLSAASFKCGHDHLVSPTTCNIVSFLIWYD